MFLVGSFEIPHETPKYQINLPKINFLNPTGNALLRFDTSTSSLENLSLSN